MQIYTNYIIKRFENVKWFIQFQVHHYFLKDQALYFVSAMYSPWEVFALCVNVFGVSRAFLSGEKQYRNQTNWILEYGRG